MNHGLKFSDTHSFRIHCFPFSISSFSHRFNVGFTFASGFTRPGLRTLGLIAPAVAILAAGLCLFTQPTMQCSPLLGHTHSGGFPLSATHVVYAGKLHFEQQS